MESSSPVTASGNYNHSPSSVSDGEYSDSTDDAAYVAWRAVFAVILACGLVSNCALVVHTVRGQRRIGSREPPQLNLFVVAIQAVANVVNCLANGIYKPRAAPCIAFPPPTT